MKGKQRRTNGGEKKQSERQTETKREDGRSRKHCEETIH